MQPKRIKRTGLSENINITNINPHDNIHNIINHKKEVITSRNPTRNVRKNSNETTTIPRRQSTQHKSSISSTINAIDKSDAKNPLFVVDYVQDIFETCLNQTIVNHRNLISSDYMDNHQDHVDPRMRSILVDWLIEVHHKFKLYPETLYLSVNLIDRYLSKVRHVPRDRLQLLGIVCFLIASKYEDIYAPELTDICRICDNAYSIDQIMAMEINVLNVLGFSITNMASPLVFLLRFCKLVKMQEQQFYFCQYLLELILSDYSFVKFDAPTLAAATIYLSNKLFQRRGASWPTILAKYTAQFLDENLVRECGRRLYDVLQSMNNNNNSSTSENNMTFNACRKKFSSEKFHRVSCIFG